MKRHVPVDVRQCRQCGTHVVEEDWTAPLLPLFSGRCMNCGDLRDHQGSCPGCGMDMEQDAQFHEDLHGLVDRELSMLNAARKASKEGRRLIALKLASAAASIDEAGQGELARAFRIWLLASVGENTAALDDAKAWVEQSESPSGLAWASLGQQYQHAGFTGSAADAYGKALIAEPDNQGIRARRASLLLQMTREGQALEEAGKVLQSDADDGAVTVALEVAERIADDMASQGREDEVHHVLAMALPHVQKSARLLCHRAYEHCRNQDLSKAKADMRAARRLEPQLDVYQKVDAILKPKKASWWKF